MIPGGEDSEICEATMGCLPRTYQEDEWGKVAKRSYCMGGWKEEDYNKTTEEMDTGLGKGLYDCEG